MICGLNHRISCILPHITPVWRPATAAQQAHNVIGTVLALAEENPFALPAQVRGFANMTPKEIGKLAHKNGINSPTLDEAMMDWLSRNPSSSKIDHFILWWEGWFEALDENLNFRDVSFTSRVSALH